MAVAGSKGIETADLRRADWSTFAALVLSPGVPLTHPEPHWSVRLAQAAGIEIIGDIELFCRERARIAPGCALRRDHGNQRQVDHDGADRPHPAVRRPRRPDRRQYRHGHPVPGSARRRPLPRDRVLVLPDRSGAVAGAHDRRAAQRLAGPPRPPWHPGSLRRHQGAAGGRGRHGGGRRRRRGEPRHGGARDPGGPPAGADRALGRGAEAGLCARGRDRLAASTAAAYEVADLAGIASLRGDHNAQNAAAAVAVALAVRRRVPPSSSEALRSFPGLAHRMEEVGRLGQTLFVNDSKATNADSTEKALRSFDNILWILGGKAKEGGIAPLRPYFPKIAKAYLIGAASDDFAETLDGAVPYARCATPRPGRRPGGGRCAREWPAGRRAAFAGLRVLRPVSEFRSARANTSANSSGRCPASTLRWEPEPWCHARNARPSAIGGGPSTGRCSRRSPR